MLAGDGRDLGSISRSLAPKRSRVAETPLRWLSCLLPTYPVTAHVERPGWACATWEEGRRRQRGAGKERVSPGQEFPCTFTLKLPRASRDLYRCSLLLHPRPVATRALQRGEAQVSLCHSFILRHILLHEVTWPPRCTSETHLASPNCNAIIYDMSVSTSRWLYSVP